MHIGAKSTTTHMHQRYAAFFCFLAYVCVHKETRTLRLNGPCCCRGAKFYSFVLIKWACCAAARLDEVQRGDMGRAEKLFFHRFAGNLISFAGGPYQIMECSLAL
jgi:hypothetical protein